MAQRERFPPPPPPSFPREAPWREIEELIAALREVSSKLDLLIPTRAAPPVVITEEPFLITGAVHWGRATRGGDNTLVEEGKSWESNIWAGYECAIVKGTGAGQVRTIESNNTDTLTLQADWDTKPDNTSFYVIRRRRGIDFQAQSVGVYLQPEWAAKERVDKDFFDSGSNLDWGDALTSYYDVPSGKTLYICGGFFSIYALVKTEYDHFIRGDLYFEETLGFCVRMGGESGGGIVFPKPLVCEGGNRFTYGVISHADVKANVNFGAWGYEL